MNHIVAMKKEALPWPVMWSYATIKAREDGCYLLETSDDQEVRAEKAAGCLLEPEVGDRVLLACDDTGECFIMGVLIKATGKAHILLPGTAIIASESGDITLEGRAVRLHASQEAVFEAPEMSFTGIKGTARFSVFSVIARTLGAHIEKTSAVLGVFDGVIGRLTERIGNSFRRIDHLEEVKAGRLRTIVRERFAVRAKQASIVVEEDVNIDGKKIHLG